MHHHGISDACFQTTGTQAYKGLQETMKKAASKIGNGIAGFLTAAAAACRQSDELLPPLSFHVGMRIYGALLIGAAILAVVSTAEAQSWQMNEDIARVAEEFVNDQVGKSDSRVTPQAGQLDSRLKLPLCDVELEAFLRPGARIKGRTAVGVRCAGTRPWKVYVPVDVVVTEAVLVSRKTLPRGHILTADDVVAENRNISRLVGGYIADPAELVGQRLKHQIMSGKIVTPSMLVADMVIKRGQTVTLLLQNNGLNISMSGKALMDGAINQRIRVENSVSRRIVEGLVRSPEHVEILVH